MWLKLWGPRCGEGVTSGTEHAEESVVADLVSVRSWFEFGEGRVGTEEEEVEGRRRRKRSKER